MNQLFCLLLGSRLGSLYTAELNLVLPDLRVDADKYANNTLAYGHGPHVQVNHVSGETASVVADALSNRLRMNPRVHVGWQPWVDF